MTENKGKKSPKPARKDFPKKQRWEVVLGVFWLLLWTGVSVIVSELIVGGVMLGIMGVESFSRPVAQAVYAALAYSLAILLAIWVPANSSMKLEIKKDGKERTELIKGKSVNRNMLGLKGLPTWTDIGLAPVGFVVSLLLAAGLVWVFSLFPWFDAEEVQNIGFNLYGGRLDRIIAFIALVIIAPIAEEIIFRGWLYGRLRGKLSREMSNRASMIISALLVSLLFGIVHLQWNVGVNVFAMSLVLCGLREVTGTIYAGILMHMIKNGLAMWLLCMWG